jgi:hypothetical protein
VVSPQLDVPAINPTDIEDTSLSDLDRQREETLQQDLATNGFGLLRVAERVGGFQPDGINQSPDVVLLARAGRSFTKTSGSTHGSFAYPTSRIPMVFCGPGIREGRTTIETAQLVDFAPTVLSLLGISRTEGMDGRPLLDREGTASPKPSGEPGPKPAAPCRPAKPRVAGDSGRLRRFPKARIVLHPSRVQRATDKDTNESSTTPVLVALTVESPRVRRQVAQGEALLVEADRVTPLVSGRDDVWVETRGKRQRIRTGSLIALDPESTVRIGSARSFSAIELRHAYVLVPLTVTLPRMPDWLHDALSGLARTGRILIDDAATKTSGAVLVAAEELERVLQLLDAKLTDPEAEGKAPNDPRQVRLGARSRSGMAAVTRSVRLLNELIGRRSAARFDAPGQMCTK